MRKEKKIIILVGKAGKINKQTTWEKILKLNIQCMQKWELLDNDRK